MSPWFSKSPVDEVPLPPAPVRGRMARGESIGSNRVKNLRAGRDPGSEESGGLVMAGVVRGSAWVQVVRDSIESTASAQPKTPSPGVQPGGGRLRHAAAFCSVAIVRPHVLLVFMTRFPECTAMLKGIANYERSHQPWAAFLDDEARAEVDPRWLHTKKWDGVISRHTTQDLAQTCEKLNLPLVDLNDTPPFPGVPKIRPDNTVMGHFGAEHFMERGYRHYGFCGFTNTGWSCERRDGFVEALRLTGHECHLFDPRTATSSGTSRSTAWAALITWSARMSLQAITASGLGRWRSQVPRAVVCFASQNGVRSPGYSTSNRWHSCPASRRASTKPSRRSHDQPVLVNPQKP